jgi:hypothetical protein
MECQLSGSKQILVLHPTRHLAAAVQNSIPVIFTHAIYFNCSVPRIRSSEM